MHRIVGVSGENHHHHGTHGLNEIAGWAENRVAHSVDISDLAAGMNDSVIHFELRPFALCSLELFRDPGLIIRMNALSEGRGSLDIGISELGRSASQHRSLDTGVQLRSASSRRQKSHSARGLAGFCRSN